MASSRPVSRRLIVRLSSLGDVILATAALSELPAGETVDWVVSREFAELLEGHPKIARIWPFDRRSGFAGWLGLCREVWKVGYAEVIDLHGSLRSRLLRILFALWSRRPGPRPAAAPRFRSFRKPRLRLLGLFTLKRAWPRPLWPAPVVARSGLAIGGRGTGRPDLRHLLSASPSDPPPPSLPAERFLCVMPGARWPAKRWSPARYLEVIRELGTHAVVLGTSEDREAGELVGLLRDAGLGHTDLTGRQSFRTLARVLAGSCGYLGNDTGLAHLAEAVGVRALMLFGPTTPEMGFGPWRPESLALGADLWCRPCGKDGRYCFRVTDRYRCQRELSVEKVATAARLLTGAST